MELGGKAGFWGWREEEFSQGQAEKPPTHILALPPPFEVPWLYMKMPEKLRHPKDNKGSWHIWVRLDFQP